MRRSRQTHPHFSAIRFMGPFGAVRFLPLWLCRGRDAVTASPNGPNQNVAGRSRRGLRLGAICRL